MGPRHRPALGWFDIPGSIAYKSCRVAMLVFYLCAILLQMQRTRWQRRFAPLAIAGRMPLTSYLMQTGLGVILVFGWGFGLWGQAGPLASVLTALVLVAARLTSVPAPALTSRLVDLRLVDVDPIANLALIFAWMPDDLERQVIAGTWSVLAPDARIVSSAHTATLWQRLSGGSLRYALRD